MKQIIITIFIIFWVANFKSYAQNDINCDSITVTTDYKTDSLINFVFEKWYSVDFRLLLKKYKIEKFNCSGGCEGVYAEIQFFVDNLGKIQSLKVLHGSKCDEPFDEKFTADFIQSFNSLIFPESLRNNCYKRHLGRHLKC
ncbi:MAG: hypothetical protein WCP69_12620 [Bacteroidota bacterium]